MQAVKDERASILAKLESMGFSSENVTGTRHFIPRPSEVASEKKAILSNEQRAIQNQKHYLSLIHI